MKPCRMFGLLLIAALFLFVATPPAAAQVTSAGTGSFLTGEALATQRAENISALFERLVTAYQEGDKETIERVAKQLDGYLSHREVAFTKDELNKMEEIAQRPEVKAFIEEFYAVRRNADVQQAHHLNNTGYLYENPMLQDYLNQLGQSLVPRTAGQFYAFRIVYDPRPNAWALSTGSIYVTTGLIAMMDNEAQLAYVLGHEIGHVDHRHAFAKERGKVLETLMEADKIHSAKRKAAIFGALAAGVGAAVGAKMGGGSGALFGAALGGVGTYMVASLIQGMRQPKFTEWSDVQERDADEFAARATLEHNFDAREAPKIFVALETGLRNDDRIGLAFHYGRAPSLGDRRQFVQSLLTGALKADLDKRAQTGMQANSPNFNLMMAALKRDNGMLALDYDLFGMARSNLEEAVALRSSDPVAHYYLGRAYKLTARESGDEQKAIDHFVQAIKLDSGRGAFPYPHLDQALALLKRNDRNLMADAQKEIKSYIEGYKVAHAGSVPSNMLTLYDYLSLTGDDSWSMPPVMNTSVQERAGSATLTPVAAPASTPPKPN